MDLAERKDVLQGAQDLHGLDPATVELLARQAVVQEYRSGDTISPDDRRSRHLYVVVEGLVSVTSRSEHRRAPVTVALGPGGVFGEDSLAGSGMMGARAYRRSTVLRIDSEAIRRCARDLPAMESVVERLVLLQRHAPWIIDHLRRSPLFENVPPSDLYPLLQGASLVRGAPGQAVFEAQDDPGGYLMVLEGQVLLTQPGLVQVGEQLHRGRPVTLGTGALVGDHAVVRPGPLLHRVVAGSDGCLLVRFPIATLRQQLVSSPSFRRGLCASPIFEVEERAELRASFTQPGSSVSWVGLVGDRPGLPLETMATWLARSAAEEWGDRVVLVHLDASASREPPPARRGSAVEGVHRLRLHPDGDLAALLADGLLADLVLVDFGRVRPLEHPRWLARLGRTIYLASNAYQEPQDTLLDHVTRPLLYTAVVPGRPVQPGEHRRVHRGTVRIHRDLLEAAHQGSELHQLAPRLGVQVSRWMRAVTERRVGLALGGGGALAFAHLALISRLHQEGVPVDLVAGVSGGAVVGAFYVAGQHLEPQGPVPEGLEELPGLARFIELGQEFARVCAPAALSSWVVSNWVDKQLGAVRLEDLLIPFFPVAVDIDQAVQVSVREGPIGFGVRASGSFPGPFTPTTIDRHELDRWRPLPLLERGRQAPTAPSGQRPFYRYVDGGVLNNIPDDTLYLEGAQAVLASNVVPAPQARSDESSQAVRFTQALFRQGSGRLPRFCRELEPLVRLDDILRAGYMMMHNPADWGARSADARYQARTVDYTFPDWGHGREIYLQQLSEHQLPAVESAVQQLVRRYRNMRWKRDRT